MLPSPTSSSSSLSPSPSPSRSPWTPLPVTARTERIRTYLTGEAMHGLARSHVSAYQIFPSRWVSDKSRSSPAHSSSFSSSSSHACCSECSMGSSSFFTGRPLRPWLNEVGPAAAAAGADNEENGRSRRGVRVVCMAHPRRVLMVAQQIKREIADMLLRDTVLKQAVLPELALGADKYLTAVATITEVELSKDLQVAKVYVSVFGDERGQATAMEGLKAKQGYVRKGIARRMRLRMTPEVRFIADDSFERGTRVLQLMAELKEERERKERGESVWEDIDEGFAGLDFIESDELNKPRKARRREKGGDKSGSTFGAAPRVEFTWNSKDSNLFGDLSDELEVINGAEEDEDEDDDLENDNNVILID